MNLVPNFSDSYEAAKVKPNSEVLLKDFPTTPHNAPSKEAAQAALRTRIEIISELQHRLHAEKTQSMLIVFQGMDASGKDSAIRKIFTGLNPAGVKVFSYDAPTRDEWQESYLKRHWREVPSRGFIVVFNRSHYEEVVTPRVFPELLSQRYPKVDEVDDTFWQQRFQDICAFEEHLTTQSATQVVKFFLHISKSTQLKRIKSRLSDPDKHWKFDERDLKARESWDIFHDAYSKAISATSTERSPWYVIPADSKRHARVLVADVLVRTLLEMNPQFPEPKTDISDFQEKYL